MQKVPSLGSRFIFLQPILVSVTRSKDIPSTWASPGRIWLPCYGAGDGNWELGLCCWALCGPATHCSSSQHGIHCGSWHFSLSHFLTCHFGLALSSLTPTTTACLTSTFPWPRHYRWCSIFYCCNSSLESVSPVNAQVNTDRSAKLILQPPKTKYFLMKIQVFHVFIQLELTWNNSLNRKWKICIWLISWHIKAKQNNFWNKL